MEQLEWLRDIIINFPSLQFLAVFVGSAIGGEVAMLTLSFLSAQKIVTLPILIIFSFLGTMCSDSFWFTMGRTQTAQKVISHRYANSTISIIAEAIQKVSRGNHLLALVFAKFLIGTRVVMLLYISNLSFSFSEFIRYNVVATLVWLSVIIPTGYLAGLGFTYIAKVFQNLYAGFGFIVLFAIVVVILQLWLKKIFIRMRNQ